MRKLFLKFKYIKGKVSCRKGMGMELALLVLLAVFACSTLLVTSAMYGKDTLMREETQVVTRLKLDELAEKALKQSGTHTTEYQDYTVVKTNSSITVKDTTGNILLVVEYSGGKITAWDYKQIHTETESENENGN